MKGQQGHCAICHEVLNKVLRALGRIEGEFVEVRKLSERVSRLEAWQSWLKGGWAVLVAGYAYLFRASFGK
jgi:hypothetical protein